MELLQYEFLNDPEQAFNMLIGNLVREVRRARNSPTIEEFKTAIPHLQTMERRIQEIEESIGNPTRHYIQEIMDELDAQSAIKDKIIHEIIVSSKAIIKALLDTDFNIDEYSFEFKIFEAICWIEFYGTLNPKSEDMAFTIVKDVFKSTCYKNGIVFIDKSA